MTPGPGNTDGVRIRSIRDEDIQAVADIYNYYIENSTVSYEETRLGSPEIRNRVDRVEEAGFPWLVSEEEGGVTGYCYGYLWNSRSAYRHTAEITVYLHPDATGKGTGMRLYLELFRRLKKQGIRTVIGLIGLPNPPSEALHEKLGLKKVAHLEKVGFKFGQWLDVGYWQGDLNNMSGLEDG